MSSTERSRIAEDFSILAAVVVLSIILVIFFSVYHVVRFLRDVVNVGLPAGATSRPAGRTAWASQRASAGYSLREGEA